LKKAKHKIKKKEKYLNYLTLNKTHLLHKKVLISFHKIQTKIKISNKIIK
jgi:hypothetical protein